MTQPFSVVMPVYKGDNPEHFRKAMDSVLTQTLLPAEIMLVVDGPIAGGLKEFVSHYVNHPLVNILTLPENIGPGAARHFAILATNCSIVAVMDSDDICVPNRFELQIQALATNSIDVVGGYIGEFLDDPKVLNRIRRVPLTNEKIIKKGRWLFPINHVTIMLHKTSYLASGGYRHLRKVEDYDLFHRMTIAGLTFMNIPEILVLVRVTDKQYSRRHGLSYLREEVSLFRGMLRSGYISRVEFSRNLLIRILVRFMPLSVFGLLSKTFLRSR